MRTDTVYDPPDSNRVDVVDSRRTDVPVEGSVPIAQRMYLIDQLARMTNCLGVEASRALFRHNYKLPEAINCILNDTVECPVCRVRGPKDGVWLSVDPPLCPECLKAYRMGGQEGLAGVVTGQAMKLTPDPKAEAQRAEHLYEVASAAANAAAAMVEADAEIFGPPTEVFGGRVRGVSGPFKCGEVSDVQVLNADNRRALEWMSVESKQSDRERTWLRNARAKQKLEAWVHSVAGEEFLAMAEERFALERAKTTNTCDGGPAEGALAHVVKAEAVGQAVGKLDAKAKVCGNCHWYIPSKAGPLIKGECSNIAISHIAHFTHLNVQGRQESSFFLEIPVTFGCNLFELRKSDSGKKDIASSSDGIGSPPPD